MPDSDVSTEENVVRCKPCTDKYGKPLPYQSVVIDRCCGIVTKDEDTETVEIDKNNKTMKCPNCRDKTQRINELTEERNDLRKYIRVMLASAGIPDKDKALRTVIQWGKEALDKEEWMM